MAKVPSKAGARLLDQATNSKPEILCDAVDEARDFLCLWYSMAGSLSPHRLTGISSMALETNDRMACRKHDALKEQGMACSGHGLCTTESRRAERGSFETR